MSKLKPKTFYLLAGIIFAVVGLLHLLRFLADLELLIDDVNIPPLVSLIVFFFLAYLSYYAFRLLREGMRNKSTTQNLEK